MASLSQLRRGRTPSATAALVQVSPCSVREWRALYAQIGAVWHWHDRDVWSDEQLAEHLANPFVSVFRVVVERAADTLDDAGFLELEIGADGAAEIVYLGLDSRVIGMGLGAWLVGEAVDRAFAMGASRVWLHTCTLDSPTALPNYLARGFTADRVETYIARLPE